MNILTDFRGLLKSNERAVYQDGKIIFRNGKEFSGDTEVPIINTGSTHLQLKTLWHLVKSVEENLDLATYLQSAKTFGVPNVSILVKDEIYKYITGKSETCSQLVSAPKESETKRKRLADWGLEDVLASEQPVTSRMTALQNVHLNLEVKPLLQEVSALNLRDLAAAKPVAGKAATAAPQAPIIIVPSARSAIINLRNAADLFVHNKYIDPNTATDAQFSFKPDTKQPHLVRASRPSSADPTKTVSVYFCDNPSKLTPEQWPRVVAVLVTGQQWQLDNFKLGNTPAEIFEKVLGYYFYFEGDIVNQNVLGWSVKRVPLARNKRHDDAVAVAAFWKDVTAAIKAKSIKVPMMY